MNTGKLQDIKVIHINPLHYYTLTKKNQKEKLRKYPIHHCNKRIKYLEINLPIETKDLYAENYKTLMEF